MATVKIIIRAAVVSVLAQRVTPEQQGFSFGNFTQDSTEMVQLIYLGYYYESLPTRTKRLGATVALAGGNIRQSEV